MLKNNEWTETDQTVRKHHGRLSKWLHYTEDPIVYSSLSHISEPMGLERDIKIEEKSASTDLRPLKFSVKRINRKCAVRGGCVDFCDGAVTICRIQLLWHLFIN